MNEEVTYQVLQACIDCGAREFVVCAGSRNSSFVEALRVEERLNTFYWPEERSGTFFALGRSRLSNRPVGVITTSGTAAGELLPAVMEAYYSGVPLILITADRPRRFRGSGAPQSAEQMNLFGLYTKFSLDISSSSPCNLEQWDRVTPIHLNVCLEEPQKQPQFQGRSLNISDKAEESPFVEIPGCHEMLNRFFSGVKHPIAIVSTLKQSAHEEVVRLLVSLKIPLMIEGVSGLREDPRLEPFKISRTDKVLETAAHEGYPVDGILRIGGIPTHRIWRDLEYLKDHVKVCSLSERPFSGLSWNRMVVCAPIENALKNYAPEWKFHSKAAEKFLEGEIKFQEELKELFEEEPAAEPSLIYSLSKLIGNDAHVYLGNSLPIREWDMAAERDGKQWTMNANRGVNGIDGQISTFLGLCRSDKENWGIFGDLTTLYDMAGCWILNQIDSPSINIVVINNGGGKLFKRMYPHKEMQNLHQLKFRPLAQFWGLDYVEWSAVPSTASSASRRFIEIIPDDEATARFWSKYTSLADRKAGVLSTKQS